VGLTARPVSQKKTKVDQKGRGLRQVDRQAYKPKNERVGQKGRGIRYVTYFYNFGTRSISLEWV